MLDCHFYRLLYIVYRSVCIISSITVADVKKYIKKSKIQKVPVMGSWIVLVIFVTTDTVH